MPRILNLEKMPNTSFLAKKGHFRQFLAKMAKTVKIIKRVLGTFFSRLQAITNCKVAEKSNEQFLRKSFTHIRTYEQTDATPKVSTTSWSRDQLRGIRGD